MDLASGVNNFVGMFAALATDILVNVRGGLVWI